MRLGAAHIQKHAHLPMIREKLRARGRVINTPSLAMLSPLAQPALVQNGLQPVWLFSRALLSRSPRAAVVLAAAAASNDGGAAPYKKEHLVWEDGFGSRFAGSLLVCCMLAFGASRSPGAWLPAAHGAQAALRRQLLRLCHRLEWWSALGLGLGLV